MSEAYLNIAFDYFQIDFFFKMIGTIRDYWEKKTKFMVILGQIRWSKGKLSPVGLGKWW